LLIRLVEFDDRRMSMKHHDDRIGEEEKPHPGDETDPGSKQSAEGICPECAGSGTVTGKTCSSCMGTGIVTVIVGDA
jgi:RecJ-like exonuclease